MLRAKSIYGLTCLFYAPALSILSSACSSDIVLATWACRPSKASGSPEAGATDGGVWFDFPWSTGYENGFCDYSEGNGSCYRTESGSYGIVHAPVHSGHYAAAFTLTGEGANQQARCHRDGELPQQAYYGAWYYVPATATNSGNWNLIHFQGGDTNGNANDLHNLWDISLINNANGALRLNVLDYVPGSNMPVMAEPPPIPLGTWFHIVMFWKRAADATGEVTVIQDDVTVLHVTDLITDNTAYGQWYVGNLADSLNPAQSTLYVDDVSVGPSP